MQCFVCFVRCQLSLTDADHVGFVSHGIAILKCTNNQVRMSCEHDVHSHIWLKLLHPTPTGKQAVVSHASDVMVER